MGFSLSRKIIPHNQKLNVLFDMVKKFSKASGFYQVTTSPLLPLRRLVVGPSHSRLILLNQRGLITEV